MTQHTDTVGAVGDMSGGGQQIDMNNLVQDRAAQEVQASNFSRLAEDAIKSALNGPGAIDAQPSEFEMLRSNANGAVGDERRAVMSDVQRPGVESAEQGVDSDDQFGSVIDRTRELYSDLTIYNVAWGIATRMQKDISQLLRGS